MYSRDEVLEVLDGAIRVQGFRPVDTDLLTESGAIDIRTGLPEDMQAVLLGVGTDPAWRAVAHQLALLKTRDSGSFAGLYLGVTKNLLRLVVVHVYDAGGSPASARLSPVQRRLALPRWTSDYDWTWDALRFLEPALGRYRLAPQWGPEVRRAVDAYGDASGPQVAAALSLLASAIELSSASRGPAGTFIGVALDGFDDPLAQRIRSGGFAAHKSFSQVPCLSAFGWHPTGNVLVGGGLPDGLERRSLERSLERGLGHVRAQPGRPALDPAAGAGSLLKSFIQIRAERAAESAARSPGPSPAAAAVSSAPRRYRCGQCGHEFAAAATQAPCPNCRTLLDLPSA